MIQNDCMTTYVDLICDRCFLCTHNSASLGLFPSAPARVHSNIDIDIDIDIFPGWCYLYKLWPRAI